MEDSGSKAQAYWSTKEAGSIAESIAGSIAASDAASDAESDAESDAATSGKQLALGMDSFNVKDRNHFGQNMRLAMALMDRGTPVPSFNCPESAMPRKADAIAQRLKNLSQDITSNTADQLELLVRFDGLEGWRASGARHCVAWMNQELGIGQSLGWEYLRVGRQLRLLPITTALFRASRLSWSKVRLLSRVASAESEGGLCHSALDASVSDLERLCNEYRWEESGNGKDGAETAADAENVRYLQQYNARSLTWNSASNGNTVLHLSLPAELAQAFLKGIEHNLQQLDITEDSMPQRRADAAVLMAETSLQVAGNSVSCADRYQVIVSVEASQLELGDALDQSAQRAGKTAKSASMCTADPNHYGPGSRYSIPSKRPMVSSVNPIAQATARRIACDCSVSAIVQSNNEPLSIGRKSRLWKPAMARAIKLRDQHCQFPGCSQTNHLQIHHIKHWASGGTTSVDNGVCLCHAHHILLHEGGYRVERVSGQKSGMDEQFKRQSAMPGNKNSKKYVYGVEAALRNSRESFEFVRRLSPTRFRFRFVDQQGCDVRDGCRAGDVEHSLDAGSSNQKQAICVDHPLPENSLKRFDHFKWADHNKLGQEHSTRVENNKIDEEHFTHLENNKIDEKHSTCIDNNEINEEHSTRTDNNKIGEGQCSNGGYTRIETHTTRADHEKCNEHSTRVDKSPFSIKQLSNGDSGIAEQAAIYALST